MCGAHGHPPWRPRWCLAAAASLLTLAPALARAGEPSAVDATVPKVESLSSGMRATFATYAPWLIEQTFLGRELWRYIVAALTVLLAWGLRRALMNLVLGVLREATTRTRTKIDDKLVEALDPPLAWFITAFGLYLAALWLNLPDAVFGTVERLYRLAVIAIVGWALLRSTALLAEILKTVTARTKSDLDDHLVPLMSRVGRVVVFILIAVFVAQEFGFNVGGLLAGLGVAGMAFALAAKDTLANWFGAMMIYTDRPFDIGDWIKTSSLEGVVEDIGLRSTRIRTFSKTVVSVPNSNLANDVIENFSRMPIRRVYFKFGVTYATTPSQMRETIERIKDILREHPDVDQSFWLVKFNEFTDSALSIMLYFFTTTTDWERYLAIREEINLAILERVAEIGVAAAFPSQSIYLEKPDLEERARLDARARSLLSARPRVVDRQQPQTAPSDDG
ncbi:MAG: mechanosensitive ion channel [Myxococcales bacterium]|nr:mechanosensitive ion channel [Myxococcales bacterium]MCB9748681.1 mechanosensitive ion channel [Myxococcales bacterium]